MTRRTKRKKTTQEAKVYKTTNYDRFVMHEFNRAYQPNKELEESMKKHGFWPHSPVVVRKVGNKLKIIQGHHRFVTAVSLGLEICYMFDYSKVEPWEIEVIPRPWAPKSYMYGHCSCGRPEYLALKEFMDDSGFPLSASIGLLTNGYPTVPASARDSFRTGAWKANKEKKKLAMDVALFSKIICQHGNNIGRTVNCIRAMANLLAIPEFDFIQMSDRINAHPERLSKQRSVDDYLDMLGDIYNFHSRKKIPIAAYAKQAAYERGQRGRRV